MALCDYLLWAAQRYVFRPGWSRPILDEAERNLVAKGTPNAPRRMQRMREAFEDADPGKTAIGRENDAPSQPDTGGTTGGDREIVPQVRRPGGLRPRPVHRSSATRSRLTRPRNPHYFAQGMAATEPWGSSGSLVRSGGRVIGGWA